MIIDREENIGTLSERLEKIENELAKVSKKVDILFADYQVTSVNISRKTASELYWEEL